MVKDNKNMKEKENDKNDKNVMSKDKMTKKFKLISESLEENVKVIEDDEKAEAIDGIDVEKSKTVKEVKDAFKIMLESSQSGSSTPKMPGRIKRRKKIDLKLSTGKKSFDLMKW